MYGKPMDYKPLEESNRACEDAILRLVKIYCLGDELQADKIVTYCIEALKFVLMALGWNEPIIDIHDTLMYLENNAGRKQSFLLELVHGYFWRNSDRLSISKDPQHASQTTCYEYFMGDPDRRVLIVKLAVSSFKSSHLVFGKFVENKNFIELAHSKDFAAAITEAWLRDRN